MHSTHKDVLSNTLVYHSMVVIVTMQILQHVVIQLLVAIVAQFDCFHAKLIKPTTFMCFVVVVMLIVW